MRSWTEYKKTMREEDLLFSLAREGDLDQIRHLTLDRERIDSKNAKGYSALMLAAYNGCIEVAEYLLDLGADPDTCDPAGSSALMGAAFKGDLPMVRLLIERGAKIGHRNEKGQTALDFANLFGRAEVVLLFKSLQKKPAIFGLTDILSGWKSFLFYQPKGRS